ncbi:hypothetical protein [Spirosoma litoris]
MIRYFVLGIFCVLRAFAVVAQLLLTATVKSTETNTVYIAPLVGPAEHGNVDSAFVSNGQFVIPGDYQSYALYRVWFKGVDKPEQTIILHPSVSLQFNGQFDWEPSKTDSVNYCYSRFRTKHETFIDQIMRLSLETDNRSLQDSLYKQRARVYKAYIDTFNHESLLTTAQIQPRQRPFMSLSFAINFSLLRNLKGYIAYCRNPFWLPTMDIK